MATELGQAYIQIMPSAKGIGGMIGGQINPEMDSAGSSAGGLLGSSIVKAVSGVVAAAGIGKFFANSLSEGGALQQSVGGIETLFKDAADTVKKNAEGAFKTAGMSANSYMENVTSFSASLISSLGGDTKAAADLSNMAMTDMSDNANKMGTDLESITQTYQSIARGNYAMLDNLKLGYGGTKSEMERLMADAEKMTGEHYTVGNFADTVKAIHAVQNSLDITGTTAKEASTTLEGSMASMKASFKNVLGALSSNQIDIGPQLKGLAETTSTFLFGNFIPMVGNIIKNLPSALSTFFSAALPLFSKNGKSIIDGLKSGLTGGLDGIIQVGYNILSNIVFGISDSLPLLFEVSVSIIDWLLNQITAKLPTVLEMGTEILLELVYGILNSLPNLINAASSILNGLEAFFLQNTPTVLAAGAAILLGLVDGILQNLPAVASSASQAVVSFVKTIGDNGPQYISRGLEIIGNLVVGIIQRLPDIVSSAVKAIVSFVGGILKNMPSILEAGGKILVSLVSGILGMIGKIYGAVASVANELIKGFTGIDLFSAGSAIMDGFLKGLKSMWGKVTDFVGGIAGWIKDHKGPISYDKVLLIPAGHAIMDGLNNSLIDRFKDVKSTVGGMAGSIMDEFGNPYLNMGMSVNSRFNSALAGDFGRVAVNNPYQVNGINLIDILDRLANRPTVVSNQIDGREFSRLTARHMSAEQERQQSILNGFNGLGGW